MKHNTHLLMLSPISSLTISPRVTQQAFNMLIPLHSLLTLKLNFFEMEFTSKYTEIFGATVGDGGGRGRNKNLKAQVLSRRKARTVGWLKPAGIERLSRDLIQQASGAAVLSTTRPAALPAKEES